jgi:anthranilate synthase component 2
VSAVILLIDNYDSFSYNLYQLIGCAARRAAPPPVSEKDGGPDIRVIRNDELSVAEIAELAPGRIVISPGPGRPAAAGICEEAILAFAGKIPILGVCLGHQAICEAFGAAVGYAKSLMHGKASDIRVCADTPLFAGLPSVIRGGRYHSLAADAASMPEALVVSAVTGEGEVMAVQHRRWPVYGVQFHPESILTPEGEKIMENFLQTT